MACFKTLKELDLSVANFFGLKNGTFAPYFLAILEIFKESVLTIISSINLHFFAVLIDQAIRGKPPSILIFLFLRPLLPFLAGIIQIILFLLFKFLTLLLRSICYNLLYHINFHEY